MRLLIIAMVVLIVNYKVSAISLMDDKKKENDISPPYIGVDLAGYYTRMPQARDIGAVPPVNYYKNSLNIISHTGLNHVRYQLYWESYEKNPAYFINELITFARAADEYKIKVIYDNHQYHTSSSLDSVGGIGFPSSLFSELHNYQHTIDNQLYFKLAKVWWANWWNRSVKDVNGKDGWILQAGFLKKIVNLVDNYPSTLGYEILNEPDIYTNNQWEQVGKYNTFIANELRHVTSKIIVFDGPLSLDSNMDFSPTSENIAIMSPNNKTNVIFKASLYGLPIDNNAIEQTVSTYVKAANLMKVPLYIGEFGIRSAESPSKEDIDQVKMNLFIKKFKEIGVWGWAYWYWSFKQEGIPSYNLINVIDYENIKTTKYFKYLGNATHNFYTQIQFIPFLPQESSSISNATIVSNATISKIANSINSEYAKVAPSLGPITSNIKRNSDGVWYHQDFRDGAIYYTSPTGAHEVHGGIYLKWASLGFERSFLGYPVSDETLKNDKAGGRFSQFQNGAIYYTPPTGAHEVHGGIYLKWASLGFERSFLGYPVSDEQLSKDKVTRYNVFQGGIILWKPNTGAYAVRGDTK